jgi:hypothetical protein
MMRLRNDDLIAVERDTQLAGEVLQALDELGL